MRVSLRSSVIAALIGFCVAGGSVRADAITLPNAYGATPGNSASSALLESASSPRTLLVQIAASELSGLAVGQQITALRWRVVFYSWPFEDATFSDYEITMAQAAKTIPSMSTTVADNIVNPVLVRDGPLSFPANSFQVGTTPSPWGPWVGLTPYTYQGGDLVILFAHTASDQMLWGSVDALDSSAPGYGTTFRAGVALGFNQPTILLDIPFSVLEIQTGPAVPEPGTLALFGLATALGVRFVQRRKRKEAEAANE